MTRARGLALAMALCACRGAPSPARRPLVIAAAADLARAFGEVAEAWVRAGHARPAMTFGSSGLLAAQIAQGAPFDAFASADVAYARAAVQSGRCDGTTETLYARGNLALVTRPGLAPARSLSDLADARFAHIAIANPEHAPYGRAARQSLEAAGAWAAVQPRMVFGENVRQALQYVQSGNADAAVVARSLVVAAGLAFTPVDEALHRPLAQALVACGGPRASDEARAFVRFVASPAGQAILRRHGFSPP